MSCHLRIGACALIATGALALPAGANAADIQTAVSAVSAHTDRADAALDRAVSLFGKNSDRAARKAFATSRKEMGLAKAAAAKARRQADTPTENTQAALAQALVGAELGENIEKLAAALLPADGSDENKIAAAARADTQGREKAIAILTALMGQVPDQAKFGSPARSPRCHRTATTRHRPPARHWSASTSPPPTSAASPRPSRPASTVRPRRRQRSPR